MKKIKYLFILLLSICALSCIDDNTEIGNKNTSIISLVDKGLDSIYYVDSPNPLVIKAPEVKQRGKEKTLNYEWQIDYKIVGKEKELVFPSSELGEYVARLKIYNEDDAMITKFRVKVSSQFEAGVMILSKKDNNTLFSFKRMDVDGKDIVVDAYNVGNPTIPLGKEPQEICDRSDAVYIFTQNPGRKVKLNSKTFKVVRDMGMDVGIDISRAQGYSLADDICVIGENGDLYNYDFKTDYTLKSVMGYLPEGAKISHSTTFLYSMTTYLNGHVIWDENKEQLWVYSGVSIYFTMPLLGDELSGHTLKYMSYCNSFGETLLVTKNRAEQKIKFIHFVPTMFNPLYVGGDRMATPKGKIREMDAGSGVTDESVFIVRNSLPIVYYTNGNSVYSMNYLSGKFEDKPIYKVGDDGDKIVQIVFDDNESKIIYGLNSKDGKGSIYCYDIATGKLLWQEKNKLGEIVSMKYKRKIPL